MRVRRSPRLGRLGALAAVLACVPSLVACGVFAEQPVIPTPTLPPGANRLQNPGFEAGTQYWTSPDGTANPAFTPDGAIVHSGAQSAHLELRGSADDVGSRVVGGVQVLPAPEFPEVVSGFYYVARWEPPEPFQYIEVGVAVHGGNHPDGLDLHQVRFLLAGAPREPFTLLNGRFQFLNRDQPEAGRWVYFSYPVREAFRTQLGWDPLGWDYIDLSFEVRYDEKDPGKAAAADVYVDDLYAGTQALDPNRPPDD